MYVDFRVSLSHLNLAVTYSSAEIGLVLRSFDGTLKLSMKRITYAVTTNNLRKVLWRSMEMA